MKFRIHGMFLSFFFAFAVVFSFSTEADAHDYPMSDGQGSYTHPNVESVTAEMVAMAAASEKEATMKKFLLHLVKHVDLIQKDTSIGGALEISRDNAVLNRNTREQGVFNNGSDIYPVSVTAEGVIISHGKHSREIYAREYDATQPPLDDLLDTTVAAEPVCAMYGDNQDKLACAVKQATTVGPTTYIVGFDHAEDSDYVQDLSCEGITISPTAKQVEDATGMEQEELLKQYVGKFGELLVTSLGDAATELGIDISTIATFQQAQQLIRVSTKFVPKIPCMVTEPDFKYKSIYPFVMEPVQGTSVMNGLDFNLHGLSVSLTDPNPLPNTIDGETVTEANVLKLFQKALTNDNTENVLGNLTAGNSGLVKYHWDDPTKDGDEVEDFLTKGQVPGTSTKESYIKVVDATGAGVFHFVVGSGIYLDDDMSPGDGMMAAADDGCSIAATGSTHESTLLNLLLIASVLFSAVFLPRRR